MKKNQETGEYIRVVMLPDKETFEKFKVVKHLMDRSGSDTLCMLVKEEYERRTKRENEK